MKEIFNYKEKAVILNDFVNDTKNEISKRNVSIMLRLFIETLHNIGVEIALVKFLIDKSIEITKNKHEYIR